jgi:hypothetical protein
VLTQLVAHGALGSFGGGREVLRHETLLPRGSLSRVG